MTGHASGQKTDNIRREASSWVAKIDGGPLSEKDRNEFDQWLKRSGYHAQEFQHQVAVWGSLDDFFNVKAIKPKQPMHKIILSSVAAIAASVLIVIGLLSVPLAEKNDHQTSITSGLFVTEIGEKRSLTLTDGSIITLNTDGQIEVEMTADSRNVRLLKGEALFVVAHDKSRPFRVTAGSAVVEALGTTFAVHMQNKQIEVLVEDGSVQLSSLFSSPTSPGGIKMRTEKPVRLTVISAGEGAVFDSSNETAKKIDQANISSKLAWRNNMLVFDGDELEQVLQEVSRYTQYKFIISDPELRKLRISGYFPTGKTDILLATLELSFDIDAIRKDNHYIYLSKK